MSRSRYPSLHARRRPGRGGRLLSGALVAVVVALVVLLAGQRIWRFATGQDIIDGVEQSAEVASSESQFFVPITEGDAPGSGVVVERVTSPDTDIPERARRQVVLYEVQSGDSIFGLAEKFHLDPNTIFWANTDTLQDNVHLINIGQLLYILPDDGVYHTSDGEETVAEIAADYGVTPESIIESEFNRVPDDPLYVPPEGQKLVVLGGTRAFISWDSPIANTGTDGAISPEDGIHPGSCRNTYTGVGGTGDFINPIGDLPYRVTTGFEGWHPGVDLATDAKDPVYASDSGVVVFSGKHNGGYGNLVILDHGNGFTTYYAHLDEFYTECGQSVRAGDELGIIGSTGFSSGLHLHFEVRKNHIPQNPYLFFDIRDVRSGG